MTIGTKMTAGTKATPPTKTTTGSQPSARGERRSKRSMRVVAKRLLLCSLLVVGTILSIGTDDEKETEKDVKKSAVDFTVDAPTLMAQYEENEVKADNRYKGKVLEVKGTVKDIGKDVTDSMYVTLGTKHVMFSIQCFFAEGRESELANLSKGQSITVKGKCDGKMGNVVLRGCVIVD